MNRILVVEDHAPLRAQIVTLLQGAGWAVEEASDGRLGLQLALEQPPDVLLLDLGLPGLGGIALCQQLRAQADRHVPVLMLTARDALDDKRQGFGAGADDYLLKPFAGEELLWRCQALARRGELGRSPVLQRGPLRIDRRTHEVHAGEGQVLLLPRQAYRLLVALAEAWPRTVTRSELQQQLWVDEPPESDALRSHLYTLRQALGAHQALVKTVHGVGLRLDVPE
ncbi:response regulator transcription factor [Roseateles asaccharophilus]|uniref:DNA-binding response OmpR family regulator n=1 Tax=Roseateles asaccharophilus TaxID=582607 RepID=A0ABU2AFM3_9BURK|nr:response regulator transcription factor [Roseateles asaccharophilus]MDR7336002.1 DNA-binding response OmpR family regulator [Roseateles asaccharophilus]